MSFYLEPRRNDSYLWPEPLESMSQLLGGGESMGLAPKMPHLTLPDVLFISLVMALPKGSRPWGIVTWMAVMFRISRPSVYALSHRTHARLLTPEIQEERFLPSTTVTLSSEQLKRFVLTAAFPGKIALRPMQKLLAEAFDQERSVGWLSGLINEAGVRAGQVLEQINLSPLGIVIAARDETFWHDHPVFLVIDPMSSVIMRAIVAPDCQADTWGIVLLMCQDQGVTFGGLVEDMAKMYPKSQKEAGLELDVQKDAWHIERDGGQVRKDLERLALAATKQVLNLEKTLLKTWNDALFEQKYIPAVVKEEQLYEQHAAFTNWFSHLCDALEVVDWRSGEIRDRETNAWLLEETLLALEKIDQSRVQSWVKTLRAHQPNMLTYLDWLAAALAPYQAELAQLIDCPVEQMRFMRQVARCWRLKQATINNQSQFNTAASSAQAEVEALIADSPVRQQMAQKLLAILDGAHRASSLIECINGLLKQFLLNRRWCPSLESLQHYLNLFTLWHNMRVYERGKRQGQSPYQLAGIDPGSDDWLELLGYTVA
ncbi:MAG: hypothetical protein AMXMBFR75_33390 [Candidatus Hinthialibacteria bacterium]